MNIARPPFRVDSAQTAEEAAEEIVHSFLSLENQPEKVSRVFAALARSLDATPDDPLVAAGYSLAKAVDHDAPRFNLPYHNQQHVCEVMLCCHYLALRCSLERRETIEITLAALFHDFRHDGKIRGTPSFRLERNSVNLAESYLLVAGITPAQHRKLAALVLATNPLAGLPVAHACYNHHHHGTPLPEIPAAAPELIELCNYPAANHALILCVADILPSLGLTIDYALTLQEKLAQEWGTPLGMEDKLCFIDIARHIFAVCDFFTPNVDRLRAYLMDHFLVQKHASETG
ncbi:HD domain-containing protein [Methylomicrobium sp. Wu6]|uniref:HD domain-containing protein n=1 Tax=Methylomicrobium sp. Wu6 TaxID=3107928 RepID=UPI002DD65C6E|nr:HD domain-containing protein [Methylomicrobium sp. Wu6]MEC4748767.1 HD domain-containing protein [Methylomicrobium sp. Wu6]